MLDCAQLRGNVPYLQFLQRPMPTHGKDRVEMLMHNEIGPGRYSEETLLKNLNIVLNEIKLEFWCAFFFQFMKKILYIVNVFGIR